MAPGEYQRLGTASNRWLANVYVQDKQILFYYVCPGKNGGANCAGETWLRRFTWTGSGVTARSFSGSGGVNYVCSSGRYCLEGNSGLTSGDGTAGSPIYITGVLHGTHRLAQLKSTDDGAIWNDYASSSASTRAYPYAISGSRRLGPNGATVGAVTDPNGASNQPIDFITTSFGPRRGSGQGRHAAKPVSPIRVASGAETKTVQTGIGTPLRGP
jgi:hypothetical protein